MTGITIIDNAFFDDKIQPGRILFIDSETIDKTLHAGQPAHATAIAGCIEA